MAKLPKVSKEVKHLRGTAADLAVGAHQCWPVQGIEELLGLTAFFEYYLLYGAEATEKRFGPKKPKKPKRQKGNVIQHDFRHKDTPK